MAEERTTRGTPFEDFAKRIDERFGGVGPRVEEEVTKVITYLNDQVVPQVRQESSQALRAAAEQLRKLADHLDRFRQEHSGRGAGETRER